VSDFAALPDDAVDRWLTDQRRAVVDDLATILDLDAGLHEVTIPARHADLVADLHDVLDVEAGLSSILPATPANSSETAPDETQPGQQLPTDLPGLVRAITSASPTSRFAMRTQPTPDLLHARDLTRDLDRDLTRDLDRARVLTLDLDLDRALTRVYGLTRDLARARDLARDLTRARARALARDLDEIHRALNDFTGADLRNADLTGVFFGWAEMVIHDAMATELDRAD
jgi:hypothetical protein